jgi:hypothetical protein
MPVMTDATVTDRAPETLRNTSQLAWEHTRSECICVYVLFNNAGSIGIYSFEWLNDTEQSIGNNAKGNCRGLV